MKIEVHGRISREPKGDQTSNGCKFGTTTRTNIGTDREYSRIDDTLNMKTTSLVYQILHRGTYSE
jgi:hypothetical protein